MTALVKARERVIEICRLDWDTSFFGFNVGRLEVPSGGANVADLPDRMAAEDYRLCYLLAPHDPGANQAAMAAGAELVDQRTTFTLDLRPSASRDWSTPEPVQTKDMANLRALALQSAEFSRFKADPRMPANSWIRLYETWIENSVNGILADAVLVERVDGAVRALLTVKARDGEGSIGLFAVDALVRGRGLGKTLLRRAKHWFEARGCSIASVVTQGNNIAACRAYESVGYRVTDTTNVYHLWAPSTR